MNFDDSGLVWLHRIQFFFAQVVEENRGKGYVSFITSLSSEAFPAIKEGKKIRSHNFNLIHII
jgi:hypothetical protein